VLAVVPLLALVAGFEAEVRELPAERRATMLGTTWRPGCPVALEALRLVRVTHHDAEGGVRVGELVVHRDVAADVAGAFRALFERGYPVERVQPASDFGGDDARSMAANNTSAFNCRPVTGGRRFSVHAYGRALDLNPRYNPYVRGRTVLPPEGARWADRSLDHPMRIDADVARIFEARGFAWGGRWRSLQDYQHFERAPPRARPPADRSPETSP
jgi:hypothetical protein